jgi:hypothetical protein
MPFSTPTIAVAWVRFGKYPSLRGVVPSEPLGAPHDARNAARREARTMETLLRLVANVSLPSHTDHVD